jgi:hypothetical protein
MAIFSSQFATIGARIAPHPAPWGVSIPAHHATAALGTGMLIVIVVLVVLIAAIGRVAREVASLYSQILKVLAAVTSVLLSIVFIAGVSVALLVRR